MTKKKSGPRGYCKVCGKKLYLLNKTGLCFVCSNKKVCKECGRPVGPQNTTGYCQHCLPHHKAELGIIILNDKVCCKRCGAECSSQSKHQICRKCFYELKREAKESKIKYCEKCGKPLSKINNGTLCVGCKNEQTNKKYCAKCGKFLQPGTKGEYCRKCLKEMNAHYVNGILTQNKEKRYCKICGKEIGSDNISGTCRKCQDAARPPYEIKYCKHCNKPLSRYNKCGYCGECYGKYGQLGENNPSYGRVISEDELARRSAATKKMWESKEYAEKVSKGVIANCRRGPWSPELRAKYEAHWKAHPEVRARLSEKMSRNLKERWNSGKMHTPINIQRSSHSKKEWSFFEQLEKLIPYKISYNETFKYIDENGYSRSIYPDGIIYDLKIVIEFQGNYYHANPLKYKADDQIKYRSHGNEEILLAQDIWDFDAYKKNMYNRYGYTVIYCWEYDYDHYKTKTLNDIANEIINIGNQLKK